MQCRRREYKPWIGKIPWKREWLPTPVNLPREPHGQRSLASYTSGGYKESGRTEWLSLSGFHHNTLVRAIQSCYQTDFCFSFMLVWGSSVYYKPKLLNLWNSSYQLKFKDRIAGALWKGTARDSELLMLLQKIHSRIYLLS